MKLKKKWLFDRILNISNAEKDDKVNIYICVQ